MGALVRFFYIFIFLASPVLAERQLTLPEKPLLLRKIQIPILQEGESKGFLMFDLLVKLLPGKNTQSYQYYISGLRDKIIIDLTQALSVSWIDRKRITKESLEKRLKKVITGNFNYVQNVEISSYVFSHRIILESEEKNSASTSDETLEKE